ncbi:hypothetical protein HMPREF9413_4719 [Paenibacillus sp. HGF7]|nr:hypothetical protein HMPREF9413_4719 [Paenibacillus sp. HGF7]
MTILRFIGSIPFFLIFMSRIIVVSAYIDIVAWADGHRRGNHLHKFVRVLE